MASRRMEIALMRTCGFQCNPPISRVNSPKRPSGYVQPVGKTSASSTISASAMYGTSTVWHGASCTGSPRTPSAHAIPLTAGGPLNRLAAKAAGDRHLAAAERRAIARASDLDRVGADGDRDRQRLAAFQRAL